MSRSSSPQTLTPSTNSSQHKSSRPKQPKLYMHSSPSLIPPTSPIAYFFWRCRMFCDLLFGVYLLEPWERIIVCECDALFLEWVGAYDTDNFRFVWDGIDTVISLVCLIMCTGIVRYLPSHLMFLQRRARYYLMGE